MSKYRVCKLLIIPFLLLGGGLFKSIARPVEVQVVIAGEIDKTTGRVTITDGEFKERSFSSIASVVEEMKRAGYRPQAVDQFRTILESNIDALEKKDDGKPFVEPFVDRSPIQIPGFAEGEKISLVIVERISKGKFGFKALLGSAHEIGGQYDLDKCEKMNKKCFICPDGKIRCKTTAITK